MAKGDTQGLESKSKWDRYIRVFIRQARPFIGALRNVPNNKV